MSARRARVLALLALFAARGSRGAGADAVRPLDLRRLGAPTFTTFTPRDGVPDSAVMTMATDREGFVWLASLSGVARYDGHRWEPVVAPVGQYRDLFLSADGVLSLTYDDRPPARLSGRRFVPDPALPERPVFRILETKRAGGELETWALPIAGGLLHRSQDGWVPDAGNAELPAGRIHALARTREIGGRERLWAATFNDGLWFREEGGRWTRYRAGAFDPAQVDDLAVTRFRGREELWVATYGFGLWRVTSDGPEPMQPASGDPGTTMVYTLRASSRRDAAGDDDGRVVWASSRGGLLRVQGDAMQVFDRRHGLPSNGVRNVHLWTSPDGTEVLWVATEAGVARTATGRTPWRTASLLGASSNGVFGVLVEPDGRGGERLWVTTLSEGVGIYEDGRWRRLSKEDGTLPAPGARLVVRAPFERGETDVLLGLVGGELARVRENGRLEIVPTPWPKSAGQVAMDLLVRTSDGRPEWWIATRESGIWRRRDGRWTEFRARGAAGQWRIVKLAEQVDRSGRSWLWASSNQGLARFDGSEWELVDPEGDLPDPNLVGLSLLRERDGRAVLWAGSSVAGIVRVDVTDPERPRVLPAGELPAAPHTNVYGALADSRGRVYACSNAGVQLLVPDSKGGWRERVFRRGDGLVHDECNTNAEFVDAHDRYWLGTLGGLSVYDPAGAPPDRVAKPLKLTHVRIDGSDRGTGAVEVAPGARELRVEFALLSWQREPESRFRSQLVGYDPAPTLWQPQNFRVFGALPPGEYTLRIEGRDYAGLESAPLEIPVVVLPAWWQSLWFRLAALLFFVLAGPLFYLHRVKRLSRQKAVLEAVIDTRTAELEAANDRLAQLSREDPLTGVANRRRLDEALDEEWRRAVRLESPLALFLLDVDHFKAYNDLLGHPAGDVCLAAVARAVAAANTRAGELVARYGGEEFAVLVPGVGLEAALGTAEHTRRRVEELALPHPGSAASGHVTVSVGVACAWPGREGSSPAELVGAADRALYLAKSAGRNCVRAEGAPRRAVVGGDLPYTPPP